MEQISGGRTSEYLFRLRREGRQIGVRVVRRRRKTMALYVEKGRMTELRAPTNCPWRDIRHFLASRFDWIARAEDELALRPTPPPNRYVQGGEVTFLGRRYRLKLTGSRHRQAQLGAGELHLAGPGPGSVQLVEKQVLRWYRRQAESIFPARLAVLNRLFADAVNPGRLTIRKMKARWGSCSAKGDICLNLLLVKEGLPQIDFVVAHELCHLRHFAHNDAFYALLDRVMPDWRDREAILGRAG